jgi:peptidoglycan-associated lipoprotein
MKRLLFAIALLALFAVIWGCPKKAPEPEPAPEPVVEEAPPPPEPEPPKPDVKPAPPRLSEEEIAWAQENLLVNIHFEFDKYGLTEEALALLEAHGRWLQQNPTAELRLEGHCDERGTVEYNLALGERRAVSAKQFLANLGIAPERLSTVSYGKERPLDAAHTEEAWAKNRRCEFHIVAY